MVMEQQHRSLLVPLLKLLPLRLLRLVIPLLKIMLEPTQMDTQQIIPLMEILLLLRLHHLSETMLLYLQNTPLV